MWTLDNMPPEAAAHLPNDVAWLSMFLFKKARGVEAIAVYDKYEQPQGMYFAKGKQILHRKRGYGRTPYEVPTPGESFASVCLPTLTRAVKYTQEDY